MRRKEYYEEQKLKKLVKVFAITLVLSIVAFLSIFVMYNKKLKAQSESMVSDLSKLNDIVSNEDLETTSFSDDLSVSKAQNTVNNTVADSANNTVQNTTASSMSNTSNTASENKVSKEAVTAQVTTENSTESDTVVEEKVLKFDAPVSGEIIKDFTMDTLSYSKTLEEWTTHPGIDIKADKTTIVTAAEEGVVESIKNDPRYGLTITISHANGFKTIYSNLLTTEFVKENENVEKGQTIATVGESSSFEISDESHLHFEMYKDGELVNLTIYLK